MKDMWLLVLFFHGCYGSVSATLALEIRGILQDIFCRTSFELLQAPVLWPSFQLRLLGHNTFYEGDTSPLALPAGRDGSFVPEQHAAF